MRVIFFGTPQFAIPSLQQLLDSPTIQVIAVVTQPDRRRGRGNQLSASPVKELALKHNLPVLQPEKIKKNPETLEYLKNSKADAFAVVAYGQILSRKILAMPKLGCINVHGSLLPKYRGAAPIQWSIYHGDPETGITTMLMDQGMDTGAMLLTVKTPIKLLENAAQVASRLALQGGELLEETLLKLEQGLITPVTQNHEVATYAPLIQKSDYAIAWSNSAQQIHNQVRGFYPYCTTQLREKSLKVLGTVPLDDLNNPELTLALPTLQQYGTDLGQLKGIPGEVVTILKNLGAVIQTGEGLLLLWEVQLAGKRVQSGWDFVNGGQLKIGEVLKSSS
jgi:methionyl-tRNA formyltransferase